MDRRALCSFALCLSALTLITLWTDEAEAVLPLEVGVGVKGGVNFSGTTKPGTKAFNGQAADALYPGFFGVGGGVGLFIEPRLLDIVGLEIGVIYEMSSGTGDLEFNNTGEREYEISTTDLIIPIHVTAAFPPLSLVKMTAGLGVDIALPLSASATFDGDDTPPGLGVIERETTTYLGFKLGVEIDALVVRVPIELRGRWNPSFEDTFDSRVSPGEGYIADWEMQGMLYVGVVYPVDIL